MNRLVRPPRPVTEKVKIVDGGRKGRLVGRQLPDARPMFTSWGFRAYGYVDPTVDISHPLGSLNGTAGRVLAQTPPISPNRAVNFLKYVTEIVPKEFGKLYSGDVMSPEEWIEKSPYTTLQKNKLVELYHEWYPDHYRKHNPEKMRKILMIHSFIKKEFYPDFKMYRAILGRNDLSKLMLGCVVKSMESVVYDNPHIVKHVPWHERPKFLRGLMGSFQKFYCGDFSSYEASIKKVLLAAELCVYGHVLNREMAKTIQRALYVTNEMKFAHYGVKMPSTRASGDVTTSLGNVLITILVWKYVLHESDIHIYSLVAEGDDNFVGTNSLNKIKTEIFEELGLICKLEEPRDFNTASFCGMIFSGENDRIITDPIKVLNRFAWLDSKYMDANDATVMSLYRGKALCILYQYRHCPILMAFARAVLRVSRKFTNKAKMTAKHWLNDDYIPSDESRLPPDEEPDMGARVIIEELYGISCTTQIRYEKFFNSQTDIFEIPDYDIFRPVQAVNWAQSVTPATVRPNRDLLYDFRTYLRFVELCSQLSARIYDIEHLLLELPSGVYSYFDYTNSAESTGVNG